MSPSLNALPLSRRRNPALMQQQQQLSAYQVGQEAALREYLPGLYQEVIIWDHGLDEALKEMVSESLEIEPMVYWDAIDPDKLLQYYCQVTQLVRSAMPGGVPNGLLGTLMGCLDQALVDDSVDTHRLDGVLPRSLEYFRCLADISCACKSKHVGTVLGQFFCKNLLSIAANNKAIPLLQWCFAICQAQMQPDLRHNCLGMLLRQRPELLDRAEEMSGEKVQFVAEALSEVARGMSRNEIMPRPRSWPNMRHHTSRSCTRYSTSDQRLRREAQRAIDAGQEAVEQGQRLLELTTRPQRSRSSRSARLLPEPQYDSSESDTSSATSSGIVICRLKGRRRNQKLLGFSS